MATASELFPFSVLYSNEFGVVAQTRHSTIGTARKAARRAVSSRSGKYAYSSAAIVCAAMQIDGAIFERHTRGRVSQQGSRRWVVGIYEDGDLDRFVAQDGFITGDAYRAPRYFTQKMAQAEIDRMRELDADERRDLRPVSIIVEARP